MNDFAFLILTFAEFKELTTTINWKAKKNMKLDNDLKILLEAGWYSTCIPIEVETLVTKQVVFLTNNMALCRKMFNKTNDIKKNFEICVGHNGLEHFVDQVWGCQSDGHVQRFFA